MLISTLNAACATAQPAPARTLRQSLWSSLLDRLLDADPGTPDALIATLLSRLPSAAGAKQAPQAKHANSPSGLATHLAGLLAPSLTEPGSTQANPNEEADQQRHRSGQSSATAPTPPSPVHPHPDDGTAWADRLADADSAALDAVWSEALQQPETVLAALRHHGIALRDTLAERLAPALLDVTLHRVEPAGYAFIRALLDHAALFRPWFGAPENTALSPVSSGTPHDPASTGAAHEADKTTAIRQRLATFVLEHLAVERGTAFDNAACLDSLLRQAAAHSGVPRAHALAQFRQMLDARNAPAAEHVTPAILTQLTDLLARLDAQPPASSTPIAADSQALIDEYDSLAQIQAYDAQAIGDARAAQTEHSPRRLALNTPEAATGLTGTAERSGEDAVLLGNDPGHFDKDPGHLDDERDRFIAALNTLVADRHARAQTPDTASDTLVAAPLAELAQTAYPQVAPTAGLEQDAVLTALLESGAPFSAVQSQALTQVLLEAPLARPEALLAAWRRHATALTRLIERMPDTLLTRLLHRLRPADHASIQRYADTLADACVFTDLEPAALRVAKWRFILGDWQAQGLHFEQRAFVRQFTRRLAEACHWPDERSLRFRLSQQLTKTLHTAAPVSLPATELARRRETQRQIRAVLDTTREPTPPANASATAPARHAAPARAEETHAAETGEAIYLDNAGLVLAAPYLPRLFAMLDLLDTDRFRDPAAAERAVHLLHYLVEGSEGAPEHRLVLNKLLCGLPSDTPVGFEVGLDAREKAAADGLLLGMIENWKGIGHTSAAGLRETFLRREGRLRLKDNAWQLRVAPMPFDMLLDSLPWSIAIIRYRWMRRVIHVDWR